MAILTVASVIVSSWAGAVFLCVMLHTRKTGRRTSFYVGWDIFKSKQKD
jgi:hypothetical protein